MPDTPKTPKWRERALDALAECSDGRNLANVSGQRAIAAALIYVGDELREAREARAREIGGGPHHGDF